MSEVHVVPEVNVRRHRTPSFWLPLSFLMMVVLVCRRSPWNVCTGWRSSAWRWWSRGRASCRCSGSARCASGSGWSGCGCSCGTRTWSGRVALQAPGARGAAPVDVTGYWVSLVTEDYIERMFPDSPRSGVPRGGGGGGGRGGGAGGAAGGGGGAPAAAAPADPCRVYGAGGSMRLPGRLNITWADDNTLKIDMDSGKQTRLLHFGVTSASLR